MPRVYNRRTKQWIKPPLGSQINWAHPLAQGLAACWLLNEQGGNQAFDLASQNIITIPSGSSFGSASAGGSAPYGNGLLPVTGGSSVAMVTAPSQFQFTGNISIVYQGVVTSTPPANYAGLFGCLTTTQTPYWLAYNATTNVPVINTNQNGSQIRIVGQSTVSGRFQCAATLPIYAPVSRTFYLYINGVQNNTGTVFGFPIQYTPAPVTIGFGANQNGTVSEFGLIYNTVLGSGDVEWLYNEPYAYIQLPMSIRYVFMSGPNADVVSQVGALAITQGTPSASVSQVGSLAITQGTPSANVSQVGVLVVSPNVHLLTSQLPTRTLVLPADQNLRTSQISTRTLVLPADQNLRTSQISTRVLAQSFQNLYETQIPVRTLVLPTDQILRETQLATRTLVLPTDQNLRATQVPIRVLRRSTRITDYLCGDLPVDIFPTDYLAG